MGNSLYEKLKAKGHDFSWYEKSKGQRPDSKAPILLNDDHCGLLSTYYLDKAGRLHTTTSAGEPYMQVRITGNKPKEPVYICACCNNQFNTFKEASGHYAEKEA